jgi:hypothetical protein
MIRVSSLAEVRKEELLPQATISKPVSYFAGLFGVRSTGGFDDLDYYEGVACVLDGMIPFTLMHYRGYPENTTTVYLPFGIQGPEQISTIVGRIAKETEIPASAIIWQRAPAR